MKLCDTVLDPRHALVDAPAGLRVVALTQSVLVGEASKVHTDALPVVAAGVAGPPGGGLDDRATRLFDADRRGHPSDASLYAKHGRRRLGQLVQQELHVALVLGLAPAEFLGGEQA